ncbi:MAG: acetate--CoA ligase family protein, partial [Pseudomonadota bacterium]
PKGIVGDLETITASVAEENSGPFVLKSVGEAHKSDHGGVVLDLSSRAQIVQAASNMAASEFLLEEMVTESVAELLVGVIKDSAHGFILTIGAGGTLTEILDDKQSSLIPATEDQVKQALTRLKMAPILSGYRNKPAVDREAIVRTIMAIQDFVLAHVAALEELEVNPLICTPTNAIAADALIRKTQ